MKKVTFLLFCLSLVAVSYAQSVQMSVVVPTAPVLVVDELRVIGTGADNISNIGRANLGVIEPVNTANTPFQQQNLEIAGTTTLGNIYANRDLFVYGNMPIAQAQVNNNLFTATPAFGSVSADKFTAKTISGPTSNSTHTLGVNSKLSSKTIEINGLPMSNPANLGNEIILSPLIKGTAITTGENDKKKMHIYYPWQNSQPAGVSNKCNSDGSLCVKGACSVCESNSADLNTKCYDLRTQEIPVSYNKAGATFQKVGTAKFYCKSVEVYNQNSQLDEDRSTCYQFMSYFAKNNIISEGFTTQISLDTYDTSRPATLTTIANPLNNITTNNIITTSDLGQACYTLCNSNAAGCQGDQEFYIAVSNGVVENFASIFGNANYCTNAASSWPKGSGLSCKSTEKIVDIYLLRCFNGSGAKTGGDTITQYRQVNCQQYTAVNGEYNAVIAINNGGSNTGDKFINEAAYFHPSFE